MEQVANMVSNSLTKCGRRSGTYSCLLLDGPIFLSLVVKVCSALNRPGLNGECALFQVHV